MKIFNDIDVTCKNYTSNIKDNIKSSSIKD